MGGSIIFVPPEPSACSKQQCEGKPSADNYKPGTIWACDDCGLQWVVVSGAQYNEYYQAWRIKNERNKDGRDD